MNLKHLKSVSYGGKRLGSRISDSRRVSDASRKNSALSIAKKLSRLVGDVWDELDIDSGSELMADKNKCKKFVDRMKSEIAKLGYTELSQEVFDYLEDWNNHSLNFVLKALNLFGNADDYYSYIIEHADRWIYTYNVFLMAYNGEFYDLKGNKVSDSRRISDYRGQYIGESQYKDKYIELADMLYRMIPDGLTYQEASEILEDEGLVLVEYGGEEYRYAVYAYEDDERFGDYGNSDAGVWLDYESDGEMYVTDAYKVG